MARGKQLSVYINHSSLKKLDDLAQKSGMNRHEYMRFRVLTNDSEKDELIKKLIEIFIENEIEADIPDHLVPLLNKYVED